MTVDKLNGNNEGGNESKNPIFFPVKVKNVIYDGTNPNWERWGGYDSVGMIFYTRIKTKATNYHRQDNNSGLEDVDIVTHEGTAFPLFTFTKQFPLINETVLVLSSTSAAHIIREGTIQNYYLPPMSLWNNPHVNPIPAIQNYEPQGEGEGKTIQDYIDSGYVKRQVKEGEEADGEIIVPLGKYFNEQKNLKPLLPYEGDTILEGRFGNSIRFGATARHESIPEKDKYNKDAKGFTAINEWSKGAKGEIGDPITIIRNGQRVIFPEEELGKKGWIHTLEDVNLDPSSIYLTSNQKIDNFLQASTNWQTFGANAVIPQSDQIEAKKCVDAPADHVTGKELGKDLEQDTEETKEEEKKPTTTTSKKCPPGQVYDEELQRCVLSTVEVRGDKETGLCGDAQLFPSYIKAISGQSFIGKATAMAEEPALDIAKSDAYNQLIQSIKSQGYKDGDTLNFSEGKNIQYTTDNIWAEGYKEVTVNHTMTVLNCDGTPVEIPEKIITEEEAGLVEPEDTSRYYDTPIEPEKEIIDGNLPKAYRLSNLEDVPYYYTTFTVKDTYYFNKPTEAQGKARCENCAFFKAGTSANNNQCSKWRAKVRSNWYCNSYGNGLEDKLKNYPNFGNKDFTITSPDPHVGKKGYISHHIDVGNMEQNVKLQIISEGGRTSPVFNLTSDSTTIAKSFIKGYIHEYVKPQATEGSVLIEFDDKVFGESLGLDTGPPPPPPGPFDYFLGKRKFGIDVFDVAGVGRAKNGGKAMKSEEIKEDSKQKALRIIYNTHTSSIGRMYATFEEFLSDGIPEITMMKQISNYENSELTKPISNKEWSVGYRWQITYIEEW